MSNKLAEHLAKQLYDYVDAYYFPGGIKTLTEFIEEILAEFKESDDNSLHPPS